MTALLFADLPLPPGADAPPATCPGKVWVEVLRFTVEGEPRPGGSKVAHVLRRKGGEIVTRGNGSPVVIVRDDGGERTANWRANVSWFARRAWGSGRAPIACGVPIWLAIRFVMPRLKGHFGTGRNAGRLKPDAPKFHTVKPDASKLTRSTEDALTDIVWGDDATIVGQTVVKVYGEPVGADVVVMTWEDEA